MATTTIRWNLKISSDTDSALRKYLTSEGKSAPGLSAFVEEAVRAHVFALTNQRAREENRKYKRAEIEAAVDEAIAWARGNA